MNRLQKLFSEKKSNLLSIYFTAGYPSLNDTATIIEALQDSGVDFIEIGLPFSDPIADGPTIQQSSEIALENGMHTTLLFDQIKDIRKTVSTPLLIMGYINPIIQFGLEKFCQTCHQIGIDGVILPDLPMQEYLESYKSTFDKYGICNIFLITPVSSTERIQWIDENSNGFIYMVSSAGTTGARAGVSDEQSSYFEKIQKLNLKNPTIVGFGISDKNGYEKACLNANGAIIGSAFIKMLSGSTNLKSDIADFIKGIKS